jgi:hypothetical protein
MLPPEYTVVVLLLRRVAPDLTSRVAVAVRVVEAALTVPFVETTIFVDTVTFPYKSNLPLFTMVDPL